MKIKLHALILIIVFVIALTLRFYKLGEIPNGLYQDETAIGYNAMSILETGKDEHGATLPLYFKSFGDYKLPVYIYNTVLSIKLFGPNEFAVRFPSAVFGFLTVVVFYFFIKELTRDKKLALFSTVLLAINPWHLHYSRATFEVSISLFLFLTGIFCLYKAFSNNQKGLFLLGTIAFIIGLYTYNLTRLFTPLLYILCLWFFRKKITSVNKQEMRLTIIVSFLLLIPFVTTLFTSGGVLSAKGTLIFSSATIQASLLELRSYLINLPIILQKLFFNKGILTVWYFLQNVASYFSVPFFFISGSTHGNHGISNVGQFYLFEFPLVALGVYKIIKNKFSWGIFMMLWAVITILVASLTREAPHATRSFFLILPVIVFSAVGLLTVLSWVEKIKDLNYKRGIIIVIASVALYNIVYYLTSYYVRFPINYAKSWRAEDKNLSLYLKQNEYKYDKIIFDKKAGFIYTSLLFYQRYSPSDFQKTSVYDKDDSEGFSEILTFGKYEFKEIDWVNDFKKKNTLIITNANIQPANLTPVQMFYYAKRPVVIAIKQQIAQYPTQEVAYVVIETEK